MRSKAILTFAAIVPLLAVACEPARGELDVTWSFAGKSCAQAGVATVQVDLAGVDLVPNQFACQSGGALTTGARLGRYLPGSYQLTVSGLDGQGATLYQSTQLVQVATAGTTAAVDAAATQPPSGSATLRWTFAGKSCAAAGISAVHISVDEQAITDDHGSADIACSQQGVDGVQISPLSAGAHTFQLVGLVSGNPAYAGSAQVAVVASQDTALNVDVPAAHPTTGSADLTWSFDGMSCAEADVTDVHVFVDPDAHGNGGSDAGVVACSAQGVDGAFVDGLAPGTHSFAITGIRHGASGDRLVYKTTQPVSAPFQAGLTTPVAVGAPAGPPGLGGALLTWKFPAGGPSCAGASSATITYTLTDPSGHALAQQTASCGGNGGTGIDFCWTGAPTSSCPGMPDGVWTLDAQTSAQGHSYASHVGFAVPNAEHASYDISFQ